MSITGIIFNQKKVVFQNQIPTGPGSQSTALQNISNVLQGNLSGQTVGIVIDATVNESHILSSEVTQYPIEQNPSQNLPGGAATVSDHVQLKPRVYNMTGIISDTPIGFLALGQVGNLLNTVQSYIGHGRSKEAYNSIVALWKSRNPFTVTTNLTQYQNMIFTSFVVDDDVDTSNEINFKATLQQLTIVTSQSISSQGQNLDKKPKIQQTAQPTNNQGTQVTNTTDPGSVLDESFGAAARRFLHH